MASKKKKGIIIGGAVTIIVTLLSFFGAPAPVISLISSIGNTVAATFEQAEEVPEVQE